MNEQERHDLFSELVAHHRSELYGYIFAVVRTWEDADDLFQSVCLVLWEKFDSFRPGTNFFAWARQTAKNKVGDFLRQRRQPHFVSEDVLETLAKTVIDTNGNRAEPYLAALRRCRAKLAAADEQLLELHYGEDLSTRQIADRLGRSQPSVCRSLNRVRDRLLDCVQRDISSQEHSEGQPGEQPEEEPS